MNNPTTKPVTKDNLLAMMTKEQLADLLVVALEGQRVASENMQRTMVLLEAASARVTELEDKTSTQEAELLVLRNRP